MLPGAWRFENEISSFTLLGGNDGCSTSRFCDSAAQVMKAKSRIESKLSLMSDGLVACPGATSRMV
jgi:hypothetical protein